MSRPGQPSARRPDTRTWAELKHWYCWIREKEEKEHARFFTAMKARIRPFISALAEANLGLSASDVECLGEHILGLIETYRLEMAGRVWPAQRRNAMGKWQRALGEVLALLDERETRRAFLTEGGPLDRRRSAGRDWRSDSRFLDDLIAIKHEFDEAHKRGEQAAAEDPRASRRANVVRDRLLDDVLLLTRKAGINLETGANGNAGRLIQIVLKEAGQKRWVGQPESCYIPSGEGERAFRALVKRHVDRASRIYSKLA